MERTRLGDPCPCRFHSPDTTEHDCGWKDFSKLVKIYLFSSAFLSFLPFFPSIYTVHIRLKYSKAERRSAPFEKRCRTGLGKALKCLVWCPSRHRKASASLMSRINIRRPFSPAADSGSCLNPMKSECQPHEDLKSNNLKSSQWRLTPGSRHCVDDKVVKMLAFVHKACCWLRPHLPSKTPRGGWKQGDDELSHADKVAKTLQQNAPGGDRWLVAAEGIKLRFRCKFRIWIIPSCWTARASRMWTRVEVYSGDGLERPCLISPWCT